MEGSIYNWTLLSFIIASLILLAFQIQKYWRYRRKYGKKNAATFLRDFHIKFLIPEKGTDNYKRNKELMMNIGWRISVNQLYIIKYLLVIVVALSGYLVVSTNVGLSVKELYENLNLGKNSTDKSLESDSTLILREKALVNEIQNYLKSNNLDPNEETTVDVVEEYIKTSVDYYETPRVLAKRIVLKINKINLERNNPDYLNIVLYAFLAFLLPDVLMIIKLYLIEGRKELEAIHCMISYSVTAVIPPKTTEAVITNMQEVSGIYKSTLENFKIALEKGDKQEIDTIIESVDNEEMKQILETVVLADSIGVEATVDSIDDQIATKVNWMDISANNRRQTKVMLAFIPVIIIFLMLFNYLIYYMTLVNQLLYLEF